MIDNFLHLEPFLEKFTDEAHFSPAFTIDDLCIFLHLYLSESKNIYFKFN